MFDPAKKQHRASFAQNFLKNPSLARYVVGLAKIKATDTVVEIGPGLGVLTRPLFSQTKHLILVEKDQELFQKLYDHYQNEHSVKVINTDAMNLKLDIPKYKVFSNPPFTILSGLLKKLAFGQNPPEAMYLFMQKEIAYRISGKPKENQLSILLKTWYGIKELHRFQRTDFVPVPAVDVNLVAFFKKPTQIKDEHKRDYISFVHYGFGQQKPTLEKAFEKIFTHEQWKRLANAAGFSTKSATTDLNSDQWVSLFTYFKSSVAPDKQRIIPTTHLA